VVDGEVPIDGRELSGHDEVVEMDQVQVDEREFSCHDEIVKMASKNDTSSAPAPTEVLGSAGSPIDFVSVAGSVRVQQNLIS
jgi:hypothetical protein